MQLTHPIRLLAPNAKEKLKRLKSKHPELAVLDEYHSQLEEIFLLRHPKYRFSKDYAKEFLDFTDAHYSDKPKTDAGNWFYFPWLNAAIHVLPEDMHLEMRTGRNKNLINKKEQNTYYRATVGILGMSVGSHAALTMAMTGGPKNMHLADPDVISGSNLNRIRIGVQQIGTNKTFLVARQIYEINPYANIKTYPEGLNEQNMEDFFKGIELLVEGMDNPYLKIKAREVARSKNVPVIMATDNGDNIFVDIERFDIQPDLPILNGLAGKITAEEFKRLDPKELPKTAAKIAGAHMATTRMQQSVLEVGQTLYSWPQLGTAANLCGSALAYLARRIILKATNILSGRYEVSLDALFEADYHKPAQQILREKETKIFLEKLGI